MFAYNCIFTANTIIHECIIVQYIVYLKQMYNYINVSAYNCINAKLALYLVTQFFFDEQLCLPLRLQDVCLHNSGMPVAVFEKKAWKVGIFRYR